MARRKYRRRRRRRMMNPRRSVISRAPLFGKYKAVKLRYCASGQLSPDSSGFLPIVQSYRANMAATPDPQIPGAVPEGWSTISRLYARCYTLGSKITVTFLPNNAQHSSVFFVAKSNVNLTTQVAPNLSTLLADRYIRYRYYGSGRGNAARTAITYPFSSKKWFTVSNVKDNIALSQHTGTLTLAQRAAYFNVGFQLTHNPGTTLTDVDYVIVIDYLCLFTEPINPP